VSAGKTKQGRGRGRIQDQPSICENSKDKRHSSQGAYARARISFKAARFRAPKPGLVQLRAASRCPKGEKGAAFERDALARGLLAPTKPQCAWLQSQKREDKIMTTTTKRPSHKVYAVTKGSKRSFWQEIGAAWAHADGEGFNIKLDMLPLNDAEIVIRKPKATGGEETTA
jgi:hypothetical protein